MTEALRSLLGLIVAAAAFLGLNFGLKWNLFVSAGLAVALYFAVYLLLKPSLRIGKTRVDSIKGGEQLHQMMADAHEDMKTIYNAAQGAGGEGIRLKAVKLHELGNRMLNYLSQNPASIPQARRFFTYYLDTGANILSKYMKLAKSNPNSAEVQRLTPETARAVDILQDAFMEQFNKLMANEVMDVEADIKLLENTLKMEG